jgi:hypothetical protein
MTWHILLIFAIAVVFYAAIPAVGAFMARSQWRGFRKTVVEVSHYPTATPTAASRDRSATVGYYRFFGTLEAIQGDDRIWITNGRFSVAADLRGVRVYLLPEDDGEEQESTETRGTKSAELGSVPWSRIFSLPEGTPVFVGGAFFPEEGRGVFRDYGATRLLVVIHDCPRESVMQHAISGGRHRNEYMNQLTLPSVVIGALSLILYAFSLLPGSERFVALIALTAGLAPALPFLPPGFPLYFAYRSFWKKARLMRVQRDIVGLPLRYFPGPGSEAGGKRATLLPDLEPYLMVRGREVTTGPEDRASPQGRAGREAGQEGIVAASLVCNGSSFALPANLRRIAVTLPPRRAARIDHEECVVFASYSVEGERIVLQKPEDPLAELVLVPGDPGAISRESGLAARSYTIISGGFIVLNVAVNLPLVFLLLSLAFR